MYSTAGLAHRLGVVEELEGDVVGAHRARHALVLHRPLPEVLAASEALRGVG